MQNLKNKFNKVKELFKLYPDGLTIIEACTLYKQSYPNDIRDIASYICGQTSFANFKKVGIRNNETIYKLNTPTKVEKIQAKILACDVQITKATRTKRLMEEKLKKHLNKMNVCTEENYDFDASNIKP